MRGRYETSAFQQSDEANNHGQTDAGYKSNLLRHDETSTMLKTSAQIGLTRAQATRSPPPQAFFSSLG